MKWFIPGSVPSSKNGRRWTGKYFIASKAVVNYRKIAKKHYAKYADEFKEELAKKTLPVHISFEFIRGTRHKFDYINPAQTVQDDMVKAGWIEDDNAEFIIPVFQKYTYNKSNPGVWIEILEDDNNHSPRTITDNTNDKESGQG
tara:strand:- start:1783 stop:2214 length:432 start_codon:yes stop_codon:yes gene_type:complete